MANNPRTISLPSSPDLKEISKRLIYKEISLLEKQLEEMRIALAAIDEGNPQPVRLATVSASDLPPVQPDQYKGMRIGAALEAYLKARPGHRIPITQVAEDLFAGGVSFGSTRGSTAAGRVQNLKIALHALRRIVSFDDDWNLQLAPTATEAPRQRWKKRH